MDQKFQEALKHNLNFLSVYISKMLKCSEKEETFRV